MQYASIIEKDRLRTEMAQADNPVFKLTGEISFKEVETMSLNDS